MIYHFKVHREKSGFWAECLEIPSCLTQGEDLEELKANAQEALNLLLDEPEDSKVNFPLPADVKKARNILEVRVDPSIAFSFLMRRTRLLKGITQHQMKDLLQFKTLFSYQKLERAKYANPTLKTLTHIKECLPEFPFGMLLD
jgi:antitoxin HicB